MSFSSAILGISSNDKLCLLQRLRDYFKDSSIYFGLAIFSSNLKIYILCNIVFPAAKKFLLWQSPKGFACLRVNLEKYM